jgi:hypothetical protein
LKGNKGAGRGREKKRTEGELLQSDDAVLVVEEGLLVLLALREEGRQEG